VRTNPKGTPESPVHILEVIGNAIVGGMENYVLNLVQQLPAYGFKITCLAPYESPYTARLRRLGVDVFVTEMHVNVPWRSIQFTTELIRHSRIDLVHAHLPRAHLLAGLAGRLSGRPVAATFHGMEINIEELSISQMTGTHMITVCQQAYSQGMALGLPIDRISLIMNGVDVKNFVPGRDGCAWRQTQQIPLDVPLVGFVGRMSFEKGPDLFVHLARHIHALRPDVHFVIVGEGPLEGDVKNLVHEYALENIVHLAGLGKDMGTIYPAFDVQAVTSRVEGLPFALLEGMACGIPSAALAVGGVAEIIEVGTTGITAAAEDWGGLGNGLVKMLEDPLHMKSMGEAARKRVEENFDLYNSLRLTSNLFRSLLKLDVPKGSALQPGWMVAQTEEDKVPEKPPVVVKQPDSTS
jgi:glycosyltransferase involved in cell wall biosynthesis